MLDQIAAETDKLCHSANDFRVLDCDCPWWTMRSHAAAKDTFGSPRNSNQLQGKVFPLPNWSSGF
jgi:hypothetical protein